MPVAALIALGVVFAAAVLQNRLLRKLDFGALRLASAACSGIILGILWLTILTLGEAWTLGIKGIVIWTLVIASLSVLDNTRTYQKRREAFRRWSLRQLAGKRAINIDAGAVLVPCQRCKGAMSVHVAVCPHCGEVQLTGSRANR